MAFRTKPHISMLYGRDKLVLDDNLEYFDPRSKELFVIPKGFDYDGLSSPQITWSILGSPFDKRYRLPSALHDFLYRNAAVSKARADQMFYDALREVGVGYFKAQAMYLGVKAFGQSSYNKKMQHSL